MINQYQRKRQELTDQLQQLQQQLTLASTEIRSAATVDEKLAKFHDRDRLMEQQRAVQVSLSLLDNEELQRMAEERSQPRFRPAV
jgi:uncharacterized NAD-dependent epimerase/dehydratase family protein